MDSKAQEIMNREQFNIIDLVIHFMERSDKFITLDGKGKKKQVMNLIRLVMIEKWGAEYYNKYKPVIPIIIEFVILVSHNGVILDINKRVKKCFLCI